MSVPCFTSSCKGDITLCTAHPLVAFSNADPYCWWWLKLNPRLLLKNKQMTYDGPGRNVECVRTGFRRQFVVKSTVSEHCAQHDGTVAAAWTVRIELSRHNATCISRQWINRIMTTNRKRHLTLWCSLLPYRYSGKASCAQGWASECPDVKNHKWRLNPVWHRMHYSCTHMTLVIGSLQLTIHKIACHWGNVASAIKWLIWLLKSRKRSYFVGGCRWWIALQQVLCYQCCHGKQQLLHLCYSEF